MKEIETNFADLVRNNLIEINSSTKLYSSALAGCSLGLPDQQGIQPFCRVTGRW